QFIHRGLAYTILVLVIIWWWRAKKIVGSALFSKTKFIPLILVLLQVSLGITTVVLSPYGNNLVWFGVAHQLVAVLFLMSIFFMLYIIRPSIIQNKYF
ncbi:MAG: COX15/CtaA family protein, partial [Ginsengibacter sp.]